MTARDNLSRNPVARVVAYELARIGLERGLGVMELAEKSGVSSRIILAILECSHNFTLSTITRLAAALDVPVGQLFRLSDVATPVEPALSNAPRETRQGGKFVRTLKRLRAEDSGAGSE